MRRLRLIFILLLLIDLGVMGYLFFLTMKNSIPDRLFAFVGEEENISLPAMFTTEESVETLKVNGTKDGFSMCSDQIGDYEVSVCFMGILPAKKVNIRVIKQMKIAPSGEPIGIYVSTKGLLVLDTAEIAGSDGLTYSPGLNLLKTGDYIIKWNGRAVPTIQALESEIQRTGRKKVPVTVRRQGSEISVAIRPVLALDKKYKIGVWVREDTQGIGTLTYVTQDGWFGTLGHGITDADTGTLLKLQGGELYRTKILGIEPGGRGTPGELQGYINMVAEDQIGEIQKNTSLGVFGKMSEGMAERYVGEFMNVAVKQDIKEGTAWILSDLDGFGVERYQIRIDRVDLASTDNKSMEITVTDPGLLKKTGGIVQGMSGSPIIQNNCVIGAVTHVLVNDPAKGYGIFIENMLSAG